MRAAVVTAMMLVLLAGCGGGSSESATKPTATATSTNSTTATPTATQTPAAPGGTAAPQALSGFRCEKDKKDVWTASGTLSNTGKAKAGYQVTVYIGEATGGSEQARTTRVSSINPGGSTAFTLNDVPAPKAGGTCHVQVLAVG